MRNSTSLGKGPSASAPAEASSASAVILSSLTPTSSILFLPNITYDTFAQHVKPATDSRGHGPITLARRARQGGISVRRPEADQATCNRQIAPIRSPVRLRAYWLFDTASADVWLVWPHARPGITGA